MCTQYTVAPWSSNTFIPIFFLMNQISASKFTPHVQLLKARWRVDMASKDVLWQQWDTE